MRAGIVWMGPVSTSNMKPATEGLDVPIMTIACDTITPQPAACITPDEQGAMLRPSHFPPWIATLGDDPIGTLCSRLGVDGVWLACFSAGAGGLDGLLQRQAGDPRILGCLAADAYFAEGIKPGYMAQAQASQSSGVPFILTTSASGGDKFAPKPSRERIIPFAEQLGMVDVPPIASMPTPVTSRGKGPVLWLDYGPQFSHVQHATKVAPLAMRAMLTGEFPGAASGVGPVGGAGFGSTQLLALAAGLSLGAGAAVWWWRRRGG